MESSLQAETNLHEQSEQAKENVHCTRFPGDEDQARDLINAGKCNFKVDDECIPSICYKKID